MLSGNHTNEAWRLRWAMHIQRWTVSRYRDAIVNSTPFDGPHLQWSCLIPFRKPPMYVATTTSHWQRVPLINRALSKERSMLSPTTAYQQKQDEAFATLSSWLTKAAKNRMVQGPRLALAVGTPQTTHDSSWSQVKRTSQWILHLGLKTGCLTGSGQLTVFPPLDHQVFKREAAHSLLWYQGRLRYRTTPSHRPKFKESHLYLPQRSGNTALLT